MRPLQLQSAVLSTELLRLDIIMMFEPKLKNIEVESNQKFYKCTVVSGLYLNCSLNYSYSIDTHSSVVAVWKADQKDSDANLLSFLLYFFISNRKDMGSNPVYSKSVNSFCSNNKLSHLSSLLQYNYLTKINHLFLFAKIFFHRNSTTPSPIHYPSYAHAQCCNIGKSTPQAKTIFLCWSISTY